MIAIAGAKGGCGKTTTTLGLARAFARSETPAVAVDADRGLPNLHVLADVDRDPTYAALDAGGTVTDIAHADPQSPNVGILPAPEPSARVSVDAALDRLDRDRYRVLIDCPSGAGPDVIEPLSAAAGAVVVTTGTDRSLEAAGTTVDVARRLGVDVAGVVGTRCDASPEELESAVGAPVLGVVPDRESPLSDPAVREVYDEIAAALGSWWRARRAPVSVSGPTLPTGIDPVDERLGGGLPEGSIVALTADPASQAEHLLYAATAVRGTLYLSTDRSASSVRHAIRSTTVETGQPTVRRLEGDDAVARLDRAGTLVEKLPEGATLIVDAADPLERADRERYVAFLSALQTRVRESASVAVLRCHEGPSIPQNRAVTEAVADAVFAFEPPDPATSRRPGERGSLSVSKFRFDGGFGGRIGLDGALDAGRAEVSFERE